MKYFYNYSFLDKWMEANRKITNKQIMKAMGTTSNACLDSWIKMKSPLPTIALLRFCNAFHVPLSAFIVDADAQTGENDEGIEHVLPGIDDQFEPDGGYIDNDEKRKLGTRVLRNPLDVERVKSVVPGWTSDGIAGDGGAKGHKQKGEYKREAAPAPMNETAPTPIAEPAPDADPGISMATLNRMLDIIAEQQKQIGDQQKLISELTHRLNIQQNGLGMVAEDIHHRE
nr:MAG TPA: repressor protein [Caudoviricetes sp.]